VVFEEERDIKRQQASCECHEAKEGKKPAIQRGAVCMCPQDEKGKAVKGAPKRKKLGRGVGGTPSR